VPTDYVVKEGDYLAKIARDHGFTDSSPIWDHPKNAELRKKRRDPNILFPGDHLFIPDRELRVESGATGQRHHFKVRRPILKLRLVLEDMYEKPLANANCDIAIGTEFRRITTDAYGRIEQVIPPEAQDALLVIRDEQTPFIGDEIPVKIGQLDPVNEISGQKARLNNLGYFAGSIDQNATEAFRSAVEEFQCDHGLLIDGICGPHTQQRLEQIHGC
jgi:N-acetylmuramoyl-L-alanine amidase